MELHLNPVTAVDGDGDGADPPRPHSDGGIGIERSLHLPLDVTASPLLNSMVAIRNHQGFGTEATLTVFPPVDHENLVVSDDSPKDSGRIPQILHQKISFSDSVSDSDSDSSSASTFSPSVSSTEQVSSVSSAAALIPVTEASEWFYSWSGMLRCRAMDLLRFFALTFSSSRGIFMTYRSVAFTASLIGFLYFWRRRRIYKLAGILKEKDERIDRLLDQVSELNRILVELHKLRRSSAAP